MSNQTPFFKNILALLQFTLSLAIFVAIAAQFFSDSLSPTFNSVTFFSYFTILSNAFAVVTLLTSTFYLIWKGVEPKWLVISKGALVVYMVLTALVFTLILKELASKDPYFLPWSSDILHTYGPSGIVIFWFLNLQKEKLSLKYIFLWLIFPLVWLLYTYIRAFLTGFYIYHFLDPAEVGGLVNVLVYIVVISLGLIVIGLFLVYSTNFIQKLSTARQNEAKLV